MPVPFGIEHLLQHPLVPRAEQELQGLAEYVHFAAEFTWGNGP